MTTRSHGATCDLHRRTRHCCQAGACDEATPSTRLLRCFLRTPCCPSHAEPPKVNGKPFFALAEGFEPPATEVNGLVLYQTELRQKIGWSRSSVVPRLGGLHACRARCSHVNHPGEPTHQPHEGQKKGGKYPHGCLQRTVTVLSLAVTLRRPMITQTGSCHRYATKAHSRRSRLHPGFTRPTSPGDPWQVLSLLVPLQGTCPPGHGSVMKYGRLVG